MTDEMVTEILKTYDVPPASEKAKEDCLTSVRNAVGQRRTVHRSSLLQLMSVQLSYMKTNRLLLLFFLILLALVFFSALIAFDEKGNLGQKVFTVNVILSPLFAAPLITALFQGKQSNMLEFEAACKYNLTKLSMAKLLINGITALLAILCVWILTGITIRDFAITRLLFSVISYNVSYICILWFGRKVICRGIAAAMLWAVLSAGILWAPQWNAILYTADDLAAICVTGISCLILWYSGYRYVRIITFEEEGKCESIF